MLRHQLDEYAPETIDHYVRQIAFYDKLAEADPEQFSLLMQHTCMIDLEPGEVLIEKDTVGDTFYALVDGSLGIFPDKRPGDVAVSELKPSLLVGALTIINHEPRTATVAVSDINGATVFATDFSIAGELGDFSKVSLATKLMFSRYVVDSIKQTLEQCIIDSGNTTLYREMKTLIDYQGEQNTLEELEYLCELSSALAWMLDTWNGSVVPSVEIYDEESIKARLIDMMNRNPGDSPEA